MKKDEMTHTQAVINHLTDNKVTEFTIREMWEIFPLIKRNTMSTLVSRDLKKKGLVTPTGKRRGMSGVYQFDPNGKPAPVVKKVVTKLRKAVHKKSETDSYDSYVKIGKGIEELIESKNATIKSLNNQLDSSKKMILDLEATVQERDRHIVEQGKKIHALSEQIRKKSGGAIKLDELQNIINNRQSERA